MFGRRERLETKAPHELRAMRRAGLVVASTLETVTIQAAAGITTGQLDDLARESILGQGARPSFPEVPGYRHTLCVSVNEAVVHGIPGERKLHDGDLVSVDCGAIVDGWHADAAVTFVVGGDEAGSAQDLALNEATRHALWAGIVAFRDGNHVGDIGAAVEESIAQAMQRSSAGLDGRPCAYGIVEGFEGHGIGRAMHMEPGVPNVRVRDRGPRIRVGAAVAIEPMITLGSSDTYDLEDGWTAATVDGSRAAHWEHTVAVTRTGLWVLTALDGGQAELLARGGPFGPLD
ncbi:MAG: type I methionyl aminopeptidase [Micrococcales bacterium]|nr:type I methionyl aminopeptidase [Micrococcales bacterium]